MVSSGLQKTHGYSAVLDHVRHSLYSSDVPEKEGKISPVQRSEKETIEINKTDQALQMIMPVQIRQLHDKCRSTGRISIPKILYRVLIRRQK